MTTLVCPLCTARWKILPDGDGDRLTVCPVCANTRSEIPANAVHSGAQVDPALRKQPGSRHQEDCS